MITTIIVSLVFGAICLGVGYLLGKRKRVISQIQGAIDVAADKAKEVVGKAE